MQETEKLKENFWFFSKPLKTGGVSGQVFIAIDVVVVVGKVLVVLLFETIIVRDHCYSLSLTNICTCGC